MPAAWLSPYDDREKMGEHAIRDGGEKISAAFERGTKEKRAAAKRENNIRTDDEEKKERGREIRS